MIKMLFLRLICAVFSFNLRYNIPNSVKYEKLYNRSNTWQSFLTDPVVWLLLRRPQSMSWKSLHFSPTSEQLMIQLENFSLKIARLEGFYFYLVAQIFVCLLWRNMRLSLKQDFDNTCQRKISVPRILYDLCQLTIYPCKQHNHNVWKSPKIAHLFLEAFDMLWLSFSDF